MRLQVRGNPDIIPAVAHRALVYATCENEILKPPPVRSTVCKACRVECHAQGSGGARGVMGESVGEGPAVKYERMVSRFRRRHGHRRVTLVEHLSFLLAAAMQPRVMLFPLAASLLLKRIPRTDARHGTAESLVCPHVSSHTVR